jgi:hypothetical protein
MPTDVSFQVVHARLLLPPNAQANHAARFSGINYLGTLSQQHIIIIIIL